VLLDAQFRVARQVAQPEQRLLHHVLAALLGPLDEHQRPPEGADGELAAESVGRRHVRPEGTARAGAAPGARASAPNGLQPMR
jgi:hypothetical protein